MEEIVYIHAKTVKMGVSAIQIKLVVSAKLDILAFCVVIHAHKAYLV